MTTTLTLSDLCSENQAREAAKRAAKLLVSGPTVSTYSSDVRRVLDAFHYEVTTKPADDQWIERMTDEFRALVKSHSTYVSFWVSNVEHKEVAKDMERVLYREFDVMHRRAAAATTSEAADLVLDLVGSFFTGLRGHARQHGPNRAGR